MYKLRQKVFPYVMLAPTILIFGIFIFYPMLSGMWTSLYQWDGINPRVWTGLSNYVSLFQDRYFWDALKTTLIFTVISVPLVYWVALGLAMLLTKQIKGRAIFRAVFYWPTMISTIVVGLSWRFLLGDLGVINYLVDALGGTTVKFLTNATWAMAVVIFVTVWSMAGYYMVMFVAGLNNIDTTYYEAAEIDGATKFQQFRFITMPLLKPTTLLVLILSMTTILKTYPLVFALTRGGPARATKLIVQKIFETGFDEKNMGYACAMTVVLFVIISVVTLIQFRINKGGEQDAN